MLLLAEHTLTEHDVVRVSQLHGVEPVRVHLLVPARTAEARPAHDALASSLAALRAAGLAADGDLVEAEDPVPAAAAAAERAGADEVLVLTETHLLSSALHRDWASRLREQVALPVLHAVAGTDQVLS